MDKIRVSTDGRIIKRGKPFSGNPLSLLAHMVDLEPGFTLNSFFSMVAQNAVFTELSALVQPLSAMAAKAGKGYPKAHEIDGLVFYKTIAMKGFPGKPGVDIYNSLKGVKADETIGLKFFQMESLLEHDFCLGELKHIIFGDSQDMFTYDTHYSLFELIEGVTWELSFNFNPLQCSIRG
ncbi:MAG TPA: hypothetical protein DHV36_00820 [Desulfobacteraceae bacterium]|nr:hypothetical protein [Desulfobacteraceae bacterium]